jgi:hypothetical protein
VLLANQEDLSERLRLQQKRIEESLAKWMPIKESKSVPNQNIQSKEDIAVEHHIDESNVQTDSDDSVSIPDDHDLREHHETHASHQASSGKTYYPITPSSAQPSRLKNEATDMQLISPISHSYPLSSMKGRSYFQVMATPVSTMNRSDHRSIASDEEPRFDKEENDDILSMTSLRKYRPIDLSIFKTPQIRQRHGNVNTTTLSMSISCNTSTTSVAWKPTKLSGRYNQRFQTTQDLLLARKVYPILYGSK